MHQFVRQLSINTSIYLHSQVKFHAPEMQPSQGRLGPEDASPPTGQLWLLGVSDKPLGKVFFFKFSKVVYALELIIYVKELVIEL